MNSRKPWDLARSSPGVETLIPSPSKLNNAMQFYTILQASRPSASV